MKCRINQFEKVGLNTASAVTFVVLYKPLKDI